MTLSIKDRIRAAEQRKAAAEVALTDADRAEIADREELARIEAQARAVEEEARALDLARRLDAAREALGASVPLKDLAIKDSDHTFIVRDPGAKAYNAWEKGIATSTINTVTGTGKVDREGARVEFAAAAVHDWRRGPKPTDLIVDFGPSTSHGADLIAFLKQYPAIASDIVGAAIDLAKQAKEARKS